MAWAPGTAPWDPISLNGIRKRDKLQTRGLSEPVQGITPLSQVYHTHSSKTHRLPARCFMTDSAMS